VRQCRPARLFFAARELPPESSPRSRRSVQLPSAPGISSHGSFLICFFVWLTVFPLQAQLFAAERWSQFLLLVQRAARSCSTSVAQSPGKGVRAPALSSVSPAQANGSSPRFHCSRSELFDFCSGCVSIVTGTHVGCVPELSDQKVRGFMVLNVL
jgi:hypothetical protein